MGEYQSDLDQKHSLLTFGAALLSHAEIGRGSNSDKRSRLRFSSRRHRRRVRQGLVRSGFDRLSTAASVMLTAREKLAHLRPSVKLKSIYAQKNFDHQGLSELLAARNGIRSGTLRNLYDLDLPTFLIS